MPFDNFCNASSIDRQDSHIFKCDVCFFTSDSKLSLRQCLTRVWGKRFRICRKLPSSCREVIHFRSLWRMALPRIVNYNEINSKKRLASDSDFPTDSCRGAPQALATHLRHNGVLQYTVSRECTTLSTTSLEISRHISFYYNCKRQLGWLRVPVFTHDICQRVQVFDSKSRLGRN